jgi:hypothetical protein
VPSEPTGALRDAEHERTAEQSGNERDDGNLT